MFTSPGDIALSIGSLSIYYYGLIMATALSVAVAIDVFITKKYYPNLNPDIIYGITPNVIIGGIIGARAYYCLLSYEYYVKNPLEIIQIWHGGISIHGAIIGGLIAGVLYAKQNKLPILRLCDIFAYGLVVGQSIGRWGNFFNSEAFGKPTENFLKLYIPIHKRPLEYMHFNYFHPTFLYESILDVCIFFALLIIGRKLAPISSNDGIIFFTYLILYSIARIVIEQVRIDSILNIYGIPVAQIISAIIILLSLIAIAKIKNNKL